ncbi:hypothetical protein CCACVL1_15528 [Corchorus capsularis]|uniref:Leucine-rich repeat-containing N-terminal plant-type domain-containing protein n=1 Tax=Corchorus capsularis TaxID=210143 RepID=A0A1R3I241_COCAP|nr:hypothetical protein CCACVL1_15528 [Corchorus capsularis]
MAKLAAALHPLPPTWSINSSSSYCEWHGVTCHSSGYVSKINLTSKSLHGHLPSKFPPFPLLRVLDFSNNSFTGSFPSLEKIPLLEELFLDDNNFTRIPLGFFQELSSHLQVLILANNPSLAPWRIPISFTRFKSLTQFFAHETNLMGSIPDIFHSVPLMYLSLFNNNLTGNLPASLGGSKVIHFWLQNQKIGLTGPIDVLSNMTHLTQVILNGNRFSGPIPDLSNCKSLLLLLLHYNHLAGVIPQSLASLPNLKYVYMNDNQLQGPMPSFLLAKIMDGSLINNNFCTDNGDPCDPQVTTLLEISSDLSYPYRLSLTWQGNDACNDWKYVTCDSEKNVTHIDLGNQQFKGTISPAFANLTRLQYLYLNDNNLTGSIPVSLTKLPNLRVLDVSNNNLSGDIPAFGPGVLLNTTGNPGLIPNNEPGADGTMPKGMAVDLLSKFDEYEHALKLVPFLFCDFCPSC